MGMGEVSLTAARVLAGPILAIAMLLAGLSPAAAAAPNTPLIVQSRFFTTSDGVRLHYLEAGPADAPTMVFVPGWTMPAWIWERQIQAFAGDRHVVAFDPRGQGQSQVASSGYEPDRRGQDIGELIGQLGPKPVLVVAWSLGVLDVLDYVAASGDSHLAGLVLVDNSVGEDPPPTPVTRPPMTRSRSARMDREQFVRSMFHTPQSADFIERLARASLQLPDPYANALLAYPKPRTFWRGAVESTAKPVLYVIRPRLTGQAENLVKNHPTAETALFSDAGHALFVDEPERFDALVADFATRRIWPGTPEP